MTFATISSFFSRGEVWPLLTRVRKASFSETVAPRQSAKSIVDDCQEREPDVVQPSTDARHPRMTS